MVLFIPALLLTSCTKESSSGTFKETIYNEKWLFGTNMGITISGSSNNVLDEIFTMFDEYDQLSDAYHLRVDENLKPIINIAYINSIENEGKDIEVDPKLADLLSFGLEMQEKTSYVENGKKEYLFNPLVGKLSTLWKNFVESKNDPLPSDESIKTLLDEVNSSSLTVNGNVVRRTGKATIDVGAFAKGYVVKLAQDYLKEKGVKDYFINGGSSSMGIGSYNNDYPYKISMKSLLSNGYSEAYFFAQDTAVGTSGSDQQGRKYGGNMYSHIVDPRNGSGLAKYDTVCIKNNDAGVADVLSTLLFVGGEEVAKSLQDKFSFEYMIFDGENVISSPNMGFVAEK